MESLGHEVVPFEDVVCQMWDMLKLGDRTYVTLQVSPTSRCCFSLNSRHLTHAPSLAMPNCASVHNLLINPWSTRFRIAAGRIVVECGPCPTLLHTATS